MQILPTTAASVAAGSVSQATSRDRGTAATSEAGQHAAPAILERVAGSQASDADRDANGGGQGLGRSEQRAVEEQVADAESESNCPADLLEPFGQLDIFG